ncbi:MAG: aminoglycoside phosphotransferase family protein [Propionibacteriaceae bacterium]
MTRATGSEVIPGVPALPATLIADADRGPRCAAWLDRLPQLVRTVFDDWGLSADGDVRPGASAFALPVRTAEGTPAVLKVGWPDPEAEHEHLALQAWGGRGAVRLLRADPHRSALLLERADPDRDLSALPVVEACTVVAGLYGDLHRPALPQLRTLSATTADWVRLLEGLQHSTQVSRRFVTEALSYARAFVDDPLTDGRLLHTDLHYATVLASSRTRAADDGSAWLAIDPKPISGDPCFEVAPLLWNRWAEVQAAPSARAAIVERFFAVVDTAGLDESRARAWVVVRELVNVARALAEPRPDQQWISACTTIAKALPT